jgi:CelD/BcsL family acetyltransferase involved in cellulose biosynthesis
VPGTEQVGQRRRGDRDGASAALAPSGAGHGFERARAAWQALGGYADYPFQTPEWIALVAASAGDDARWGVLERSGRPVAVTALGSRVRRAAGLDFRVVHELRVGESGLPFVDGLLDPACDPPPTIADVLAASFDTWHVLLLRQLRAGSPWLRHAAVSDCHIEAEPQFGAGVLDTARTYEDLLRAMPSNMRNTLRKTRRKVSERGGAEFKVHSGAALAKAIERHLDLEASGWKGREGTALRYATQEGGLVRDYNLAAPTAQIRSLEIDGSLLASQVTVTIGRTCFLSKIAFDEEHSDLSPGNVLMAALIETCCADPDIDHIDCMVWYPWHQRWGMVREPTHTVVAFNRASPRAGLARAAWRAAARLRAVRPRRDGRQADSETG